MALDKVVTARPFLRWAGGKAKLAERIIGLMPSSMKTYYEPFLGGGAVFFALEAETFPRFDKVVLADANEELMAPWIAFKRLPSQLEHEVLSLAGYTGDPEIYNQIRESSHGSKIECTAARMIYLNQSCFNGLWRVNAAGDFNVPHGGEARNGIINQRYMDNFKLVAEVLAQPHVALRFGDFAKTAADAGEGDVVYCDPPYLPLTETANFTAFAGEFNYDSHMRLTEFAKERADNGATVIISNHDTPVARELYKGFEIHDFEVQRSIAAKGEARVRVGELLAVRRP